MKPSARNRPGAAGHDTISLVDKSATEDLAKAIAKRCVFIIRGCLREEEWLDAEEEFARIISDAVNSIGQ